MYDRLNITLRRSNVYDRLVMFDPNDLGKDYVPGLAESWTVSPDGKTFTFKMRAGVKFHSGNPFTANDAAFSLQRAVLVSHNLVVVAHMCQHIAVMKEGVIVEIMDIGTMRDLEPGDPYTQKLLAASKGYDPALIEDKDLLATVD